MTEPASRSFDDWDARVKAWVERTCAEQGVPVKLSDPVALPRLAEDVGDALQRDRVGELDRDALLGACPLDPCLDAGVPIIARTAGRLFHSNATATNGVGAGSGICAAASTASAAATHASINRPGPAFSSV